LASGKYNLSNLAGGNESGSPPGDIVAKFIPRGWYYLEQLNYCRIYQMQLGGTSDASQKRLFPERIQANTKELEREFSGHGLKVFLHHKVVAALLLPALGNVTRKTAQAQTSVDQAVIACGLERYRLANGQFPEKLESLAPQFIPRLPTDMLTGEPYNYRRTEDGQFVLYSVGWDQKDDGGRPGRTMFDEKGGNWVWR
jgi:hypothetical protein